MLKKISQIIKKIVFSFLLVYSYNMIIYPIGMLVPLNYVVLGYISIFGIPAFLSIIVMLFLI